MFIILLCSLSFINTCLSNLTSQGVKQNAPITIKVPQNSKFTQIQIQQLKKQFKLDSLLNIEIQPCEIIKNCQNLIIIDTYSESREQILLPASTSRIRQSLIRHLMKYQKKIEQQKLKSKKLSSRTKYQLSQANNKKLIKISKNILAHLINKQKDDWERADLITSKVDLIQKMKTITSPISINPQIKQVNSIKSDRIKSKSDVVIRQLSDIYRWYFIYILLSAIVIFGMKYMNQQEKRILLQSKQFADCPHHCNQEESV